MGITQDEQHLKSSQMPYAITYSKQLVECLKWHDQ